ncbi:unnamed protein product [Prorocentrum cordatum]|uniref:Uncharacterized protein n=1 Tax=Prorocentrum cordatum TaxID=2364126 RepID=A0ABN9RYY5_9DINO|nr:unnamed protein product [Polarella glacialis]
MAAGPGSAAVLCGAAGARASADRLVTRQQSQLAAAMRQPKDAEEALLVIIGDGEVAARVRCLLPALAALVEGRAPTWFQRLRRNAVLHAAPSAIFGIPVPARTVSPQRISHADPRFSFARIFRGQSL